MSPQAPTFVASPLTIASDLLLGSLRPRGGERLPEEPRTYRRAEREDTVEPGTGEPSTNLASTGEA